MVGILLHSSAADIETNQYFQNVLLKNIAIDSGEWSSSISEKSNAKAEKEKPNLDLEVPF
jgi:hypothetical protein